MDLNNFIPDNNASWVVRGRFLMFRKIEHIPVCFTDGHVIYVFLDARLVRQMISLVKHLKSLKVEFYFTIPEASSPKGISDYHEKVIRHYLLSYAKDVFFNGFRKIDFDLVDNLVKWTDKENCFNLVKEIYEDVLKVVTRQSWDYYSNKKHYDYCKEIRDEFQSLYRHIQISKII